MLGREGARDESIPIARGPDEVDEEEGRVDGVQDEDEDDGEGELAEGGELCERGSACSAVRVRERGGSCSVAELLTMRQSPLRGNM